jgi:tetratricopeptide (TPR) repeat protein
VYDVDTGHETLALPGFRFAVTAMTFSPDGRRLAAGGMDPIVIVWDAAEPTDVERAARRRTLEQSIPGLHLREGEESLREGHRYGSVYHFDRAVNGMPDHAALRARKGYVHAQFGDWGLAADDYAAAAEKGRLPLKVWFEHALVQLNRDDKEGYRKTCARLLQGADRITAPDVINTLVWACAVGPDGTTETDKLIELQQKATKAAPRNYAFANTLGAVLYRAGKYEEAIKQLEAAIKLTGRDGTAGDWLFLAMAQHQLGKKEAAREWLDKSQQWFERSDPTRRKGGFVPQLAWEQWQELDLVRREAEALLGPTSPRP